jgi:heme-degrading monooxygenase HmoA
VIERHWRGLAKVERAQDYVRHLRQETFPGLKSIEGFLGASVLRRVLPQGVEFVVITRWSSLSAILRFAGDVEPTRAVVPAVAAAMMIEYDSHSRHYEVVG